MAPVTRDIDPDADAIIILTSSSTIFAPWGDVAEDTSSLIGFPSSMDSKSDVSESNEDHKKEEKKETHFRVSSRHLALASPWFKRALAENKWSESSRDTKDGLFHLTAADWDAEAFLIMLNVFHVRHREVPRELGLEMLAKIALLIDYYECGEVMEFFSEMWISAARAKLPRSLVYDRTLVLWMWVSWIFGVDDLFTSTTSIAIWLSRENFNTLGLPIPAKVYTEIDSKRILVIQYLLGELYKLLERFCDSSYLCPIAEDLSFQCGAYQLGLLTKTLGSMAMLSPRPASPYANLSLSSISHELLNFKSPKWSPYAHHARPKKQDYHTCDVGRKIGTIINIAHQTVTGLDLSKIRESKTD